MTRTRQPPTGDDDWASMDPAAQAAEWDAIMTQCSGQPVRLVFRVDRLSHDQLVGMTILPGLTNIAEVVARGRGRQQGAREGGRVTAAERRESSRKKAAAALRVAKQLERDGHMPHEVASLLAKRYDVSSHTVRRWLRKEDRR